MSRPISLFDVQAIMEPLASGQLILTPNQRLASRIRSAYALACGEQGKKVVAAPAVFSLTQWIERCWQYLLINAHPLATELKVLSPAQEQLVWEQIVSDSNLGTALLRPAATARQAAAAYGSLIDWRQLSAGSESCESLRSLCAADTDSATLLGWIDQFETRCADRGWLPSARRVERVQTAFIDGALPPAGAMLGIGFEDIAPLQRALISAAGTFHEYVDKRRPGTITVVECDSANQELLAAAVWAKQVLKNDAGARVAIVIPELAQQRHTVQRLLQEVFDPDYCLPLTAHSEVNRRRNLPFNLSAGLPLLEAPVISAALNALALGFEAVECETLRVICQSPFYALQDSDVEAVSRLIGAVHEQRELVISSARFRQLAVKVAESIDPSPDRSDAAADDNDCAGWHFADRLQRQATIARACTAARPAEQWPEIFQRLLTALGWPGQRVLDSIEYQQVTQWQQVISEFSGLSSVATPFTFDEAVSQLRGMLSRHIFQPQTADSSLQVLGTLEAAGLQFSHLWLQSMSEQHWPPSPSPNPLLPFSLQRRLGMPHATAERELDYAIHLTQRFIHSADRLIVSAPRVIDDNPVAVSSLFAAYPRQSITELLGRPLHTLVPLQEIRRRFFESQTMERFDGGDAPVVGQDEKIYGGSSVFASQSACPFKAFARHRLGLTALPEPEPGLNAADRGLLLHRALELLWQKLRHQRALLALTGSQQATLCDEISRYAVNELAGRRPSRLGARYKELEVARLRQLLDNWLQLERQRANFSVESIEDYRAFRFEQLELQTRIDRIDRLDDNSLLIIDYKTASSSINRWWGERPDEPQLPLYTMLADGDADAIGGVAFAQVRHDHCALKGVGSEQLPEPLVRWRDKIKADAGAVDWPQLKRQWKRVLSALARDFIAGRAAVDPKQPAQTCQYCDLAGVCRVAHRQVESA